MDAQKVALVTGGSRGLGAEAALTLSASGFRVAFNYLGSRQEARSVLSGMAGPDAMAFRADVTEHGHVSRMARLLRRAWGRLDLLVNNAGISRDSLLARAPEDDWDSIIKVNLRGAFNMTRGLAGLMSLSGGGHIINVSSRSGLRGKEGQAAYAASKAALIGLTLASARELAPEGIRVNAVLPGYMRTDMGNAAPGAMEAARSRSLLGSLSSASDAASFMAWLSGTSTVTGQVFSIDSRIG
jgi:3-oxoacyl-[acyl-carrier protein] reductase